MTALGAALEALEQIAARGITVPRKPGELPYPGEWKCGNCGHVQKAPGVCLNRDCLTNIARRGIDEARRAL